MTNINILYISIEGNTRSFVQRLTTFAAQQHTLNHDNPTLTAKEITEQTMPAKETEPFIAMIPTYLDGGNGFDSGFTEIMTTPLGEYIAENDNAEQCVGVIGSGNKNFNEQYCLTARKYANKFNAPFLADYELRGTDRDVQKIYETIRDKVNELD